MSGGLPYMQGYPTVNSGGHGQPVMHAQPAAHSIPPQPQPAHAPQPPQVHQGQQQQQFQRLKVEDALSYLDQVKLQFGNQPQVYNDFLDIMKEFKSQTIDTPGVINRVSSLFRGHPDLIVGFNTFLPPGYKIEIQSNDTISVHQPNNTVLSLPTGPTALAQPPLVGANLGAGGVLPQPITSSTHHSYHQQQNRLIPQQQQPAQPSDVASALHHTSPPHLHQPLQPSLHHQQQQQTSTPSQPVEFNHAISYVNKIKNRFHGQPDIYKSFLEILHTYQKEQRNIKEGLPATISSKPLTETEVYTKVAKLFQNQEDLLTEFGQFLPDGNGSSAFSTSTSMLLQSTLATDSALGGMRNDHSSTVKKPTYSSNKAPPLTTKVTGQLRRPATNTSSVQPAKKIRLSSTSFKDVTLAEAGKHGTLTEYAYFDKVRKALRNPQAYDNFLRALVLFTEGVVSRTELVHMAQPFLSKHADLYKWFKDFLGYKESGAIDPVPQASVDKERINSDIAMDIDYSSCKRYGASYRALPKTYDQPQCSGRTELCKSVLNDTWVSFPSWSEDSTFVSSRKTQFEEHIYRCEDERFELDVVIETNLSTIKVLEGVQKKLQRMSPEDAAKFKLDNTLGGNSEVLHRKAIQRLYGDKTGDILDGLKKNPVVVVPLIIRRLRAKDEEWREAQRGFNKLWKEQNEKFYLKSLDHQGINFKQNDTKAIRNKALINEIETLYDERSDQLPEGAPDSGPHLTYTYKDPAILDDAAQLIIHHMTRQPGIHADEKHEIKQLLKHFVPDMFHLPRGELSDDEGDNEDDNKSDTEQKPDINKIDLESTVTKTRSATKAAKKSPTHPPPSTSLSAAADEAKHSSHGTAGTTADAQAQLVNGITVKEEEDDDKYALYYGNNNWYLFFRLHELLCDRLHKIRTQAEKILEEDIKIRVDRKESTAIALRLKAPNEVEPEDYYAHFLECVKNLLDGNLEGGAYEDILRELFGIHAYVAFTMDKIVQSLVRQMQNLVADENPIKLHKAYHEALKCDGTGGYCSTVTQRLQAETNYQRKVEHILRDENCYKFFMYKSDMRLTIELLDTESEPAEDATKVNKWCEYMNEYMASNQSVPEDLKDELSKKPVFLLRNMRRNIKAAKKRETVVDGENGSKERGEGELMVEHMDISDHPECEFKVNSFKMVYVLNSESYLYKRTALTRAKKGHSEVSLRLHKKFSTWLKSWQSENLSKVNSEACDRWLMGDMEDRKSCHTERVVNTDMNKAPYYQYNRYVVKYPRSPHTSQTDNKPAD